MRCLQCVATLSKIRNFKEKLKTSRFLCCQKIKLVNECVNCIDGISIRIFFISTGVCRHLVCVARVSGFSTLKEKLHLFAAQKLERKQKKCQKSKNVLYAQKNPRKRLLRRLVDLQSVGARWVLCKSLGRGVSLGLSDPYPILDHVQVHCTTYSRLVTKNPYPIPDSPNHRHSLVFL